LCSIDTSTADPMLININKYWPDIFKRYIELLVPKGVLMLI
jgi:hypothetical protein